MVVPWWIVAFCAVVYIIFASIQNHQLTESGSGRDELLVRRRDNENNFLIFFAPTIGRLARLFNFTVIGFVFGEFGPELGRPGEIGAQFGEFGTEEA